MSDKMKIREGKNGYSYPYTSPDLVIDENGKSTTTKFNEISSQFKDIANLFSTEQTTNYYKIKYGNKVIAEIPLGSTVPTVTKYTITNTLSNATNSNSVTDIEENQSYTAIITANKGYDINKITVTMGGNDITSSVVNGNNINISQVTGNITITVTTVNQQVVSSAKIVIDNNNLELNKTEQDTINVSLDKAPNTNQTVMLNATKNFTTLDKKSLTFTPQNYNVPQTVTITGKDVGVEHIAVSNGENVEDVVVGVLDYDPNIIYEPLTGDEITANIIGNKCYVTSINTTKEYVLFPKTITYNGKAYTNVSPYGGFGDTTKATVKGIKFEDGIFMDTNSKIGFGGCTALRYIENIPSDYSTNLEFTGCTSLVSLPKIRHTKASLISNPRGGPGCQNCSSLKVISQYPSTLTGTLSQTYWRCNAVEDISNLVIPEGITNLHECYANMGNLKVGLKEIPSTVTSISQIYYGTYVDEVTILNKELDTSNIFNNTKVSGNIIVNSYIDSTTFDNIRSSVCLQDAKGTPKLLFKPIEGDYTKICCWGDSLTMGQGVTPNYPTALRDLLSDNTLVYCYGIGGSSIEDISSRMDTFNKQLDDGIHIIWGGTNYSNAIATVESYKNYVKSMVSKLSTDKYIIMTPVYKSYNIEYDTVFATEFGEHFFSLRNWFDNNNHTIADYVTDGTHFNAEGNNLIAQAVKEKLIEIGYIVA
jgi:lysophospholipase L1-like esterase